jgi:hypothetical protein
MVQIALLAGSRPLSIEMPPGSVALPPPPPPKAEIVDIGAAVRDALRFPLSGPPLEALVRDAKRAVIVVEPPALPIPGALRDPRLEALVAASDELERSGIPSGYQTILVTSGLGRKLDQRGLASLATPEFALRFHGLVAIHDVEDANLVELGDSDGIPLEIDRVLAETDLVLCVTAAESVLNGGPNVLLAAGGRDALRAAQSSPSLLETSGSRGWQLALALERLLERRAPLVGVSLALGPPRLGGMVSGYPFDARAVGRLARSRSRRLLSLVPGLLRWRALVSTPTETRAIAVYAGSPSVAHAEALLTTIEARATEFTSPFDVLCIPIPDTTLFLPRERPNPLAVAAFGLGYAFRRWRDQAPLSPGGVIVLAHDFERRFAHPSQQPYRNFFGAARAGRDPETLARAEHAACDDARQIAIYRAGRSCHPLAPFADWEACQPALERASRVVVAGCRNAATARQLGFIPSHGIAPALELASGSMGDGARVGFMLGPPYAALRPMTAPDSSA